MNSFVSNLRSYGEHACGVQKNGDIVCWGSNTYGQTDVPAGLG